MRKERWIKYLNIGLALTISAICILPYLYLCFFSFPNAEDLSLSIYPRDIGWWYSIVELFLKYDGRYFTNMVFGVNPLVFNCWKCYPFFPLMLLGLFIYSVYAVANLFLKDVITSLIVVGLFISIYLVFLPSPPHSIYWLASSVVFLLPIILLNFQVVLLYKYFHLKQNNFKKGIYGFEVVLLIMAIIGTNEMFLVIEGLLCAFIFFYYLYEKEKENILHSAYFLGIAILSTICFIVAPGIRLRWVEVQEEAVAMSNSLLFFDAIRDAVIFALHTFTTPFAFVAIVLVAVLVAKSLASKLLDKKILLQIGGLVLFFGLLSLLAFYLPMGGTTEFPTRVYNIFLFFLIGSIVLVFAYVIGHFVSGISPFMISMALILALILLPFTKEVKNTYSFIITGKHQLFKAEMTNTFKLLEAGNATGVVEVKNPTNTHSVIAYPPYFESIDDFWTQQYVHYFMLKKIIVLDE